MVSFKPILIETEEREEELPEKEFIEDKSNDTMSLLPPAQTETAYPSMPLVSSFLPDPHLTSTEKAIVMQSRGKEPFIDNITLPGTEEKIASAGIFPLKWDVTKSRIGPVTNSLSRGCGWVELVAQVSKRRLEPTTAKHDTEEDLTWGWGEKKEVTDNIAWPSVEVFTPEGKFVAARRPMNA
ncbi:hypothetical protein DID88_009126 [Monilinia fructigena]|uniref:Uncharacterized protein n=1 Tax=Monilinia fructigena TaxID=38457 RepID=A0A395IF41_9HELO|nr:hypothetical protein DID88_009126 [Monilinia fructigena]